MTRLLPVAAAFIVLLFSGLVHGVWTERWAESPDLDEAVAKLDGLPLTVGDWRGKKLDNGNRTSGGLAGSISCCYVHRQTGKEVTVFLACGRPTKVAIHTPDVCYAASGFEMEPNQEFTVPPGSAASGSQFYTARAKKMKAADQTRLRIFWSWNPGGKWQIADSPRVAFANRQILYKLYFIREMASATEPLAEDPCLQLMHQLLPVLQPNVLPAS
ncbi:MAG TPA: exosortase-associated EpsI family protein [Gemmataceae bacterium]|nr:exosortase-associated EpsI family protein [Gemmataceae bacterium]